MDGPMPEVRRLVPCGSRGEGWVTRLTIVRPAPIVPVAVARRRAVDVPPRGAHLLRHEVRHVLVGILEGPVGEEVPHNLVGLGASYLTGVREEHEVHRGLPVELEGRHDARPQVQGAIVHPALGGRPVVRQAIPDEQEVLALGVEEVRVVELREEPAGRVLQIKPLPRREERLPRRLLGLLEGLLLLMLLEDLLLLVLVPPHDRTRHGGEKGREGLRGLRGTQQVSEGLRITNTHEARQGCDGL